MTLPVLLDAAYLSMLDDISPPLMRADARELLDNHLDGGEDPNPETWGTSPQALAAQAEMEAQLGGPAR